MTYRVEEQSWDHTKLPVKTAGTAREKAKAAVILLHGRGEPADDMLDMAKSWRIRGIHWIALQAEEFTWYPLNFTAPAEMNQPGLDEGMRAIQQVVDELKKDNFTSDQIGLVGFSQGASVAAEYAARNPNEVGVLVAFCGGLVGENIDESSYASNMESLQVFMGYSDCDLKVPEVRMEESARLMKDRGADVESHIYPGIGHHVNNEELKAARKLLRALVK